jgi:hypothetical protein
MLAGRKAILAGRHLDSPTPPCGGPISTQRFELAGLVPLLPPVRGRLGMALEDQLVVNANIFAGLSPSLTD